MKIMYNVKHRYAVRLKFVEKFLTSLAKLVLRMKAIFCSTTIENLFFILP